MPTDDIFLICLVGANQSCQSCLSSQKKAFDGINLISRIFWRENGEPLKRCLGDLWPKNPYASASSAFYPGQGSARSAPLRENKINCHSVWWWDCVVASLLAMTDRVEFPILDPSEVNRQILSIRTIRVWSATLGGKFTNQCFLAAVTSWKLVLHFIHSCFNRRHWWQAYKSVPCRRNHKLEAYATF